MQVDIVCATEAAALLLQRITDSIDLVLLSVGSQSRVSDGTHTLTAIDLQANYSRNELARDISSILLSEQILEGQAE